MNIDEIQTFLAIVELGGFTRAGRQLHRSQPAISRRLGMLEHELGAPLFERLRGRARLTEAGRLRARSLSPSSAPSPTRTSWTYCVGSECNQRRSD